MNDPITGIPEQPIIPEQPVNPVIIAPEQTAPIVQPIVQNFPPITSTVSQTEVSPTVLEVPVKTTTSLPENANQYQTSNSPLMPTQELLPVTLPEIPSTIPPQKKSGMFKKIVVIILVLSLLGGIGLGGTKAYYSLKLQFNPLVSPVVENLIYSPGEQFTARINQFIDTIAIGATSELKDLNYTVETDFTAAEIAAYKKNIGSKFNGAEISFDTKSTFDLATPVSGVLGITSNAGKIDQSFLNELSTAKKFVVNVAGAQSIEFSDRNNPKSVGEMGIQLELPNSQVSTTLDSLSLNKINYAMLKSFPENDYLDLSSIMNKWILVSSETTTDLTEQFKSESLIKKEATIKKKDVENIKKVLAVEEFSKRVKSAPSVSVNGVTAKCYSLTLDTESAVAITKAMQKKAVELKMTKDATNEDISQGIANTSAATTDTTVCFANSQFVPTRISTNTTYSEKENSFQFLSSFTFSPLSIATSFAPPDESQVIKVENIDGKSLLKGDALKLYEMSEVAERNYKRQTDLSMLSLFFHSYDIKLGNSKKDFGKIPQCKSGVAKIAFLESGLVPIGTINIYPLLTKNVIFSKEEIPREQEGGTYADIGYTVCLAANNLLQFSAPKAEGGEFITE